MTRSAPLREQRSLHGFIVLVALLLGLALYLAQLGREHHWGPFAELSGCVYWYTLVLAVPTTMTLSVQRLADARFWQQVAGVTAAYALLATWAAWSATGAPDLRSERVLTPFALTAAAGLFVLLPYLQCRLTHGRWRAPDQNLYPELFEHAWQNGLTLLLVLPFVGLCWAVLWLWGALFALVRIEFFRELFGKTPFIYLATGTMVGLGILIARTQARPLQILRQVVFAVFRGLLPLLAFIALLFLVSLPFTGVEPLWQTRRATPILVSLVYLIVLFTNAVFQDCGSGDPARRPAYPRPLWHLIQAALIVLPVYAGIALYSMGLRVDQYGWTSERFFGVLFVLLVNGHALGYAGTAVRSPREAPLRGVPRVNLALSLVSLAVVVAINSPLADPHRISVASQIERLRSEPKAEPQDLSYLRFDSGRRGYEALQALQRDPALASRGEFVALIGRVLASKSRWTEDNRPSTAGELRARLELAAGTAAPDDAWLQLLIDQVGLTPCMTDRRDCLLLDRDLDGDGQAEHLLWQQNPASSYFTCQVYTRRDGKWAMAGHFDGAGVKGTRLDAGLRAGRLETRPPRWPDVVVDGQRFQIDAEREGE